MEVECGGWEIEEEIRFWSGTWLSSVCVASVCVWAACECVCVSVPRPRHCPEFCSCQCYFLAYEWLYFLPRRGTQCTRNITRRRDIVTEQNASCWPSVWRYWTSRIFSPDLCFASVVVSAFKENGLAWYLGVFVIFSALDKKSTTLFSGGYFGLPFLWHISRRVLECRCENFSG